jgi:hypothetical protein
VKGLVADLLVEAPVDVVQEARSKLVLEGRRAIMDSLREDEPGLPLLSFATREEHRLGLARLRSRFVRRNFDDLGRLGLVDQRSRPGEKALEAFAKAV